MIAEPAAPATGGPNIASERSTRRDDPADAYGNLTFRAFPLIRKRPTNIDPIFKITIKTRSRAAQSGFSSRIPSPYNANRGIQT
jgi:hypothetical protein